MSKDLKELKMFKSWEVSQVVEQVINHSTKRSNTEGFRKLDIMKNLLRSELSSYVLDDLKIFAEDPKDTIINYSFSKFNYLDETETTVMNDYIQVFANQDPVQVQLGWFMVLEDFRKEIEIVLNAMTDVGMVVQTTDLEERVIDDLKFELPIVTICFIRKGGR